MKKLYRKFIILRDHFDRWEQENVWTALTIMILIIATLMCMAAFQ